MPAIKHIPVANVGELPGDGCIILTNEATGEISYVADEGHWWDCTITSNEQTLGISVVGMAQAGKSTLCNIVDHYVSEELAAPGGNFNFSVSNGNRGITACILEAAKLPADEPITLAEADYKTVVATFVDGQQNMDGLLRHIYANPAPTEVLRSLAVNSAVAWTSEHPAIASRLHQAGGRFLGEIMADPTIAGLEEKPTAVLMDARNRQECREKFSMAGISEVLAVVLECPEEVVADRKLRRRHAADLAGHTGPDPAWLTTKINTEAARLKSRNTIDRQRTNGGLTLGKDFPNPYYLDELIAADDGSGRSLAEAGLSLAGNTEAGLVIRTNISSQQDEAYGFDLVMRGVLRKVGELRYATST